MLESTQTQIYIIVNYVLFVVFYNTFPLAKKKSFQPYTLIDILIWLFACLQKFNFALILLEIISYNVYWINVIII